jgi:hypothetical protein
MAIKHVNLTKSFSLLNPISETTHLSKVSLAGLDNNELLYLTRTSTTTERYSGLKLKLAKRVAIY